MNNIQSVVAKPRIKNPMPVPIIERSKTGLRPYLSDSLPRMGEKTNCMMEYDAKNNLLTGDLKEIASGKEHSLRIDVTDAAGNASTVTTQVTGSGH